jgi:uncharacterized coiled-coil protein SlyX
VRARVALLGARLTHLEQRAAEQES